MAVTIKLSGEIIYEAEIAAKFFNRSVAGQIEHWIQIGKIAEANPDLTYEFIKDILLGLQELESGEVHPYSLSDK